MAEVARGVRWALLVPGLALAVGCANISNKITGTPRAGAEQLLLTGTSDCAVGAVDFGPLAGARVFLDASNVEAADKGWVIFSIRRAMAEQGLLLADSSDDAQVIIEAALGAYGTDERSCRFTLPMFGAMGLSNASSSSAASSSSSDLQGLTLKSNQDAVVKLALFGFDAGTRRLIWESGTIERAQFLDRNYIGTENVSRRTSLPDLEAYPPRRSLLGWSRKHRGP